MESQSSTKRIKFSRLCLSQGRTTKDGQSSSNSLQSSQISKFFNRPPPVDNNIPSTSNAQQTNLYMETPVEEGSASSSPPTQSEIEKTLLVSSDTNTKELNVPKSPCNSGRVKTKRVFEAANPAVDSKKTIKNFFAAEHDGSLNDFEVPKKVARKTSNTIITKSTSTKRSKSTKERRKKQPDIRRIMQKQNEGLALDEDEELQLAMELSKAESSEQIDRPNFDQFAYKPKNGSKELAIIFGAQKLPKGQSKWKSKCTPLTRRDDQVQSLKKNERVDDLLTDNILIGSRKSIMASNDNTVSGAEFVFEISSSLLQRICMAEKILFELNDNDVQSNRCLHQYYTNNLVEPSTVAGGALLKDWKEIPGRDSVFDGILTTSIPSQKSTGDEHFNDIVQSESTECVERARPDAEPSEIPHGTQNDIVCLIDEEVTDTAGTDDTIILDTNALEVELNFINSRIRSSQNFVENPVPSVDCDSERTEAESHRGPSPDLFDDDDDDYGCDANYLQSDSLTCSNKQTDSDADIVLVEDSPSADMNEERSNNEIFVNETVMSPTNSENSSGDDKCSLIEISDESNHSTAPKSQNKNVDTEVAAASAIATASTACEKRLSFTERLQLMDLDVLNEFKSDVAANLFDYNDNHGMTTSQQLSQDSIELSDDEINYSMNYGKKFLSGDHASSSTTAKGIEQENYNDNEDINIDYGCNAIDGENELQLINQSICEMFEKTFEYRDVSKNHETRDESTTPKQNSKVWKKTRSERVLGAKQSLSPFKRIDSDRDLAPVASTSCVTSSPTDLSTDDYIIRYGALSPKLNYDSMELVDLQSELKKFGLKQSLKKRQAIICLEYIYNRTHPYIADNASEIDVKAKKARSEKLIPNEAKAKLNFNIGFSLDHLADGKFQRVLAEQVFLPSWPRAKRPWCLQPLHIAWHNLVKANAELFETILTYQPIELRDLKNYFKTIDMTFDNKDLIAFLDVHCITFRTSKSTTNC